MCLSAPAAPSADVIAQPSAFAHQARLAIEAAHRVAPADGEAVLRCQRRAVPLRADQARVDVAVALHGAEHHGLAGRHDRASQHVGAGDPAVVRAQVAAGVASDGMRELGGATGEKHGEEKRDGNGRALKRM